MIPDNYIPHARAEFDDFNANVLDRTLRSVPISVRRDKRNLTFLVSQDTHDLYIKEIAARVGDQAYAFLLTVPTSLTYGGIPVVVNEEIPDGMIEIYGPPDGVTVL